AGVIWGLFAYIGYYIKFSTIKPNFLITPFVKKSFLSTWEGHLLGLFAFILYSIVAALIYAWLLYKRKGAWPGIAFGLVWWLLMYAFVGPYFDMLPPLRSLSTETWLSESCRHILWGVFIGYSITLEFTDERVREPARS